MSVSDKLFFLHVPKTAGQSVAEIMSALFAYEETATNQSEIDVSDLESKRFVSGHGYWSQLTSLSVLEHFYKITFLRNPFARYQSERLHIVRDSRVLKYFRYGNNAYCRRFTKLFPFDGHLIEDHYKSALDTLQRDFHFVGITEHFRLSVEKLAKQFGISHQYVNTMTINQHPTAQKLCKQPQVEYDTFYAENKYDFYLYERLKEQLERLDTNKSADCFL